MERRDFLKLTSMAGLGVVAGNLSFESRASAADPYNGPLWVFVNAGGGWDPTSFCDPKGTDDLMAPDPMNHYLKSEIAQIGNFRVAPDFIMGSQNIPFFTMFQNELIVINGIDCATNSHDAGSRVTWSGTLQENKPCLAALIAGIGGPTKPMAFITNGGYDATGGVVALSRIGSLEALKRIAYPDRRNPDEPESLFYSPDTTKRIAEARYARNEALMAKQQLPNMKKSMGTLFTARTGSNELAQLTQYLPDEIQNGLLGQADIAIAAYQAGICISANLSIGGFDTHGDHDDNQLPQIGELMTGVMYLWQKAAEKGVPVNIICGSDFGRTPGYNDGNGKDHWSITSMMFLGASFQQRKGTVIGATDDYHKALTVDGNLQVAGESGTRIAPGHVHKNLRKLAGIDGNKIMAQFPLKEEEDLNFFL